MKAYNGGSIGNLVNALYRPLDGIYVTDTPERAAAYANAQATSVVDETATNQGEGTVVLTVEFNQEFHRRADDHFTLDKCEAYVPSGGYQILEARIRFHDYKNTVYGKRYLSQEDVLRLLEKHGIKVRSN